MQTLEELFHLKTPTPYRDPNPGDVFTFPKSRQTCMVGKVIGSRSVNVYVVIFRVPESWFLDVAGNDPEVLGAPVLSLETMTTGFEDGSWTVVGTSESRPAAWLPVTRYRGADGEVHLSDYHGARSRVAEPHEAREVPLRSFYTPGLVERAAAAEAGLQDSAPYMESMRVDNVPLEAHYFPAEG